MMPLKINYLRISLFACALLMQLAIAAQPNTQALHSRGFIENKGQILNQDNVPNAAVKYLLSLNGMNVQLKNNSFSYDTYVREEVKRTYELSNQLTDVKHRPIESIIKFHRIDIEFIGANKNPEIIAETKAEDYLMYYNTVTPEAGVKAFHYAKIIYKNLYPGIDLEFYARSGTSKPVEYNFIVHPGADASLIQLKYTGANKAELIKGKINLQLAQGLLQENIPKSWLMESQKSVAVSYSNKSNSESFIVEFAGEFDPTETLIIDPTPDLLWTTDLAGNDGDRSYDMSVDGNGNSYLTGFTNSVSGIATSGAHQTSNAGSSDVFLARFSSGGTLVFATYYGGTATDIGYGLAVDKNGNSFITGTTGSTSNIATVGAHKILFGGFYDAFLSKFNSSGVLQWATYFGGPQAEESYSVSLDSSGNPIIAGNTSSLSGIAGLTGHQIVWGGAQDGFVAKFTSNGIFQWSTYYGGSSNENVFAVTFDVSDNVYIHGTTGSTSGISTSGSHQIALAPGFGSGDAFLVKFNSNGVRQWGTYFGGTKDEIGNDLATDTFGNCFIVGFTSSSAGIATSGCFKATSIDQDDGYLAKFSSAGTLRWSTYYGDAGGDKVESVATDQSGNVFITGFTGSVANIATADAYQKTKVGGTDAFIGKFDTAGTRVWGSYFGTVWEDEAYSIAIGQSDNVYISGYKVSGGGAIDAFVTKFSQCVNQGEISILGNGIGILIGDTTPSLLDSTDFGSVITGTSRSFTIQNNGIAPLSISSIKVSGPDSSKFVVNGAPSTIAASGTGKFNVTINHIGSGIKKAFITINNSDCDEANYKFEVKAEVLPLGIAKVIQRFGLEIVPNPASNVTILKLHDANFSGRIYIYAADGKLMWSEIATEVAEVRLNLKEYPAGFYSIQTISSGGCYSQKLLISGR